MKRTLIILVAVVAVLVISGVLVWRWTGTAVSPPFAVGSKHIEPFTSSTLAVGNGFAAMIAPDGTLWGWGNSFVDLGIARGWKPQRMGGDRDWKQVTAGYYGLLALKQDGSLWAIGQNQEGLLGLPVTNTPVTQLTRVGAENDWREVRGGVAHCMALKQDGSVWTWGQNNYGQIGIGKISPNEPPTRIGTDTNWIAITPGAFTSFALKDDGTVWGWGTDFTTRKSTAPVQLGDETNWNAIAAGEYHVVARKKDGSHWLMGANAHTIIPDEPNAKTNWTRLDAATNWVEVYSGLNAILAKTSDKSWKHLGWTDGLDGKWKFPDGLDPLAIGTQRGTTLMLMRDGKLWSLGKRIGVDSKANLLQRIEYAVLNIFEQNASISTSDWVDHEPYLIWEQGVDQK